MQATAGPRSAEALARTGGLVDALLAAQRELTAVERFAQRHADVVVPLHGRTYRDLVPLSAPAPDEQYAFAVDLDACTGCKACVTACHRLNGLDPGETWRSVGLLVGGSVAAPVQQTITTACHHCGDPGCLAGCPVRAYEKDAATGIVRHLDDQCIGCRYCEMTCPYEVPQYSPRLGIVRKCDLCHGRLATGEAPACVQACPNGAITVTLVRRDAAPPPFPPDCPDPALTRPTTRYRSARGLPPSLRAGDRHPLVPAETHAPLVAMLALTQLGVGASAAAWAFGELAPALGAPAGLAPGAARALAPAGLAALLAGLAASVLHLGRPAHAWRAFLGWRTSWMSREILAFGAAVPLLAGWVLSPWAPADVAAAAAPWLGGGAVATATAAVGCSAMIYHATRRPFWTLGRTLARFGGTVAILGCAAAVVAARGAGGPAAPAGTALVAALAAVVAAKLCVELSALRPRDGSALGRTGRLLRGPLRRSLVARVAAAGAGVVLLVASGSAAAAAAAGLLLLGGELLERRLFFAAVAPARMPGTP